MESITQFSGKFQALLDDIERKQDDMQKDFLLVQSEAMGDIAAELGHMSLDEKSRHQALVTLLEDLRMPVCRIESTVQKIQDGPNATERQNILNWVSTIPHRRHHGLIHSDVLPGTGEWFLNDQRLLAWQNASSPSFIWLHGIPGSGKSKLT